MPINANPPFLRQRLFRLRSILLTVMFMVLALPLGGLYFFRIYENELVQQTERELIAQAAVLSAGFRQLVRTLPVTTPPYGRLLRMPSRANNSFEPITPMLSLINPVWPPRPDALPATQAIDPIAQKTGLLMMPVLKDTQHYMLSGIRLLDLNGTVIAGREEIGQSLAHLPEIQRAMQGYYTGSIRQRISDEPQPSLYSISRGTHIRVFVAFPVIENQNLQGVIFLSRTPNNILKHLFDVRKKVVVIIVGLFVLVVLLVILVSAAISRPIRELIAQTERVKSGEQKLIEPLKNPVSFEIAKLSESFASMSKALMERTDYIQRFATHVSHEFKTPLTSMQGALELLQDHGADMPPEQRELFIANLLSDTTRLKQLVNRLLELARADALEPRAEQSSLQRVVKALENRYLERGLKLAYVDLPGTALAVAPDALEMVLSNLFENSLQHGATLMTLSALIQQHRLELNLQDNGAGISEANRNKIFTPFFTTRRNNGGTGLGLEITQSLLKTYGGKISLGQSSAGALFVVSLPLVGAGK